MKQYLLHRKLFLKNITKLNLNGRIFILLILIPNVISFHALVVSVLDTNHRFDDFNTKQYIVLGPHKSLMHHSSQKLVFYDNSYLMFSICDRKDFEIFGLKKCLSCTKNKFAGQKLFSVFGPAKFFQFKSDTDFRL